MTRTDHLKEPPVEAIKGGYWITQARLLLRGQGKYSDGHVPIEHASFFLADGLRHLEKAVDIIAADGDMFYMQPGPGMVQLYEALDELRDLANMHLGLFTSRRLSWKIASGHEYLRVMMKDLGYRTITNRDFAIYGDGGGR